MWETDGKRGGGLLEGEVDGGGAAGGHGVVLGVGELLIGGDGSDFPGADGDGGAEVVGPGCIGGDLPQATVDGDGGTADGLAGGIDDLAEEASLAGVGTDVRAEVLGGLGQVAALIDGDHVHDPNAVRKAGAQKLLLGDGDEGGGGGLGLGVAVAIEDVVDAFEVLVVLGEGPAVHHVGAGVPRPGGGVTGRTDGGGAGVDVDHEGVFDGADVGHGVDGDDVEVVGPGGKRGDGGGDHLSGDNLAAVGGGGRTRGSGVDTPVIALATGERLVPREGKAGGIVVVIEGGVGVGGRHDVERREEAIGAGTADSAGDAAVAAAEELDAPLATGTAGIAGTGTAGTAIGRDRAGHGDFLLGGDQDAAAGTAAAAAVTGGAAAGLAVGGDLAVNGDVFGRDEAEHAAAFATLAAGTGTADTAGAALGNDDIGGGAPARASAAAAGATLAGGPVASAACGVIGIVRTGVRTRSGTGGGCAGGVHDDGAAKFDLDGTACAKGQVAGGRRQGGTSSNDDVAINQLIAIHVFVGADIEAGEGAAGFLAEGAATFADGPGAAGGVAGFDVFAVAAFGSRGTGTGAEASGAADGAGGGIEPGGAGGVADFDAQTGTAAIGAGRAGQAGRMGEVFGLIGQILGRLAGHVLAGIDAHVVIVGHGHVGVVVVVGIVISAARTTDEEEQTQSI